MARMYPKVVRLSPVEQADRAEAAKRAKWASMKPSDWDNAKLSEVRAAADSGNADAGDALFEACGLYRRPNPDGVGQ